MQRLRVVISAAALVATIALGLCWNAQIAWAEFSTECNCIDGFTGQAGVRGWDPIQERYRCVPGGCYVITE